MNKEYDNLKSELAGLLEDRGHKIDALSNIDPLFLLLTSKQNLAAFSLLNGDPLKSYENALHKFRELYAAQSNQWADYNLTLVLCRQNTNTAFSDTYNNIETDPYFCQKFVIDLGNLHNDLKRLPFIPLSPKIVEIERPISAQTFLMKHGLNTELARYLAVPHKKREEGILEGCITGELGNPAWHKNESAHFIKPAIEDKKNIVRLKTLAINNFRAYRKETFDLDADLIVFFGPNGFGKTSTFDAIDFICTGSVGRFNQRYKDSKKIPKILGNLDSKVTDALVTATFSVDGTDLTIERNLDNRSYARINNEDKNRAGTLLQLTGLMEEPPDMRVDNLINLFRATHLFGQEFQYLTSDVKYKSHIHEDTVSRMLAIQDYVEAINKTQKVNYLIDGTIRTNKGTISSCEQDKAAKESELLRLMSTAKGLESPDSVSTVGKELLAKIKKSIDVDVEPSDKYDQEIARMWRANIEVEIHMLSNKLSLVGDLEEKLPEMQKHKILLQEKNVQLSKTKELIGQYEKEIADKVPLINKLKLKSSELTDENKKDVLRGEHLKWFLKTTDDIKHINSQINELDKTYNDTQTRCHDVIEKASKAKSNVKNIEEVLSKETTKLQDFDHNILKFGELQERKDDWLRLLNLCREKEVYLQTNQGALGNAKKDLAIMRQNYEMTSLQLKKLQEEIERLQEVQSERLNILDRIQQYIDSNICPVCGVNHNSKEDLIEKLQLQKGLQTEQIRATLQLFETNKTESEKTKRNIDGLELKVKQIELELAQAGKELLVAKQRITIFERTCSELDIPIDPEKLNENLKNKKDLLQKQIEQIKKMTPQKINELQSLQREFTTLESTEKQLIEETKVIEIKKRNLESMSQKLRNEAVERHVILEMRKDEIDTELGKVNSHIIATQDKINEHTTNLQANEKEVNNLIRKKTELDELSKILERGMKTSESFIAEVDNLIKKLELKLEIETITDMKRKLETKLSAIENLHKEVINYEISLDAVQTAASIAKIRQDINNLEKALTKAKTEEKQYEEWSAFFKEVHEQLERLRKKTLTEYTSKYGPLTSLIQRRLRQVYGFGDIKLHPEKEGISVKVSRRSEKDIAPSDYFSESQIQILMLSLFMSAALTQTWSSFAPVLLDDPVTHFDDLNAYSFIELIRGLVGDSDRNHQFIISTCEDRLFRLMYQKFKKMDGRVIFYKFESIGENGPRIKRIQ